MENGSKATCSGASISAISQANAALNTLIDDIVERVTGLNERSLVLEEPSIPLFVVFLIYKAAVITTRRVQSDLEPEANLLRLRVLRGALVATMQRWLAGSKIIYLLLLIISNYGQNNYWIFWMKKQLLGLSGPLKEVSQTLQLVCSITAR